MSDIETNKLIMQMLIDEALPVVPVPSTSVEKTMDSNSGGFNVP